MYKRYESNLCCGMEGHIRIEKDLSGPSIPYAKAATTIRRKDVIKEDLDSDSGRSSLCLVNEHIQRNILVCALCKQLYTQPKVGQARIMVKHHHVQLSTCSYCPVCTPSVLHVCGTGPLGDYFSIKKSMKNPKLPIQVFL